MALRKRVESILKPNSPVLSLVSEEKIRRLLDTPVGTYSVGAPWSARSVLERLIEFNTWISEYNVSICIEETPELLQAV